MPMPDPMSTTAAWSAHDCVAELIGPSTRKARLDPTAGDSSFRSPGLFDRGKYSDGGGASTSFRWSVSLSAFAATGTFNEAESQLEYALMYSNDGGATWFHCQDDTVATPGTRPDSAYLEPDSSVGAETYNWSVPLATFPEGSYLLRIDCFRQGAQVHYSFHKTKIFIQR